MLDTEHKLDVALQMMQPQVALGAQTLRSDHALLGLATPSCVRSGDDDDDHHHHDDDDDDDDGD